MVGMRLSAAYLSTGGNRRTTVRRGGALFTSGAAKIVLTVHPGHLHVTFDGRTIIDWHSDPERLYLESSQGVASRETPFIGVGRTKYIFESAQLIPLRPETAPARPPRLKRDVDLLPLVDLERDVARGIWGIDKNTVYSAERWAKIYLPCVVPEEYTLSGTVELPPDSQGEPEFAIGLVSGNYQTLIHVKNDEGLGIDTLDGRRWHANDTRRSGSFIKPGVPSHFDCTVTRNGIRMELDGRTLIDWRGESWRLSVPGDWAIADAPVDDRIACSFQVS